MKRYRVILRGTQEAEAEVYIDAYDREDAFDRVDALPHSQIEWESKGDPLFRDIWEIEEV